MDTEVTGSSTPAAERTYAGRGPAPNPSSKPMSCDSSWDGVKGSLPRISVEVPNPFFEPVLLN